MAMLDLPAPDAAQPTDDQHGPLNAAEPGAGELLDEHHSSHSQLIEFVHPEHAPQADVDAILVPAARSTGSLRTAIRLAASINATCLVLCSKDADARRAADLGRDLDADVVAVDVNPAPEVLPEISTDKLLVTTGMNKNVDVAFKRNLAMLVARMSSWRRVFFLDDDVNGVRADDVRRAAGLLHDNDAVGLWNTGFPDNSVVCHAHRETSNGGQDQFLSTMALAVTVGTGSFFPDIYNEDWFFILGEMGTRQIRPHIAATGSVEQSEYDPFADPARARREEFGDTLAEGLVWLLDTERPMADADLDHWDRFLVRRRAFIKQVLDRIHTVRNNDPAKYEPRIASLEAALQVSYDSITPELCRQFVHDWRADLETWRTHLEGLGVAKGATPEDALRELGFAHCTFTSARPSRSRDRLLR